MKTDKRGITRRQLLMASSMLALPGTLSAAGIERMFMKRGLKSSLRNYLKDKPATAGENVLVLIHLAGGNDGLSTLIPHEDPLYRRARPKLAIPPKDSIRLESGVALNPGLSGLAKLFDKNQVAAVHGVGYPKPNRSHFRSLEIWETASDSDEQLEEGWIARLLNAGLANTDDPSPGAMFFGSELPDLLVGSNESFGLPASGGSGGDALGAGLVKVLNENVGSQEGNLQFINQQLMASFKMEAEVLGLLGSIPTKVNYPNTQLARQLRSVAELVNAGLGTRIYHLKLGGFDTHAKQARRHQKLMQTLGDGLLAFQKDLRKRGVAERVLTMTYSEFGRRPWENKGGGTDHGTAAPVFLVGSEVKPGFIGQLPKIPEDSKQDLRYSIDFRQIYRTIMEQWFDDSSGEALFESFSTIPVLDRTV